MFPKYHVMYKVGSFTHWQRQFSLTLETLSSMENPFIQFLNKNKPDCQWDFEDIESIPSAMLLVKISKTQINKLKSRGLDD